MNFNIKILIIIMIFGFIILYYLILQYINICMPNYKLKLIDYLYGPDSFIRVDNKILGNKYNLIYGELTSDGMKSIIEFLNSKKIEKNTFIDLGCGNGKTLVYAILYGFKEARGAEIVEVRYKYAEEKKKVLDKSIADKIKLTHSDIFDLEPLYFPKQSVIFISNLLYHEETNNQLFKFLSDTVPDDTIIIMSKIQNNLYKLKVIKELNVPMSWSYESICYVLQK
jgi:SAM-dependent methyltransferase